MADGIRFVISVLLSLAITSNMAFCRQPQTVLIRNGNIQGSGLICGSTPNNSHRLVLSVAHVTGDQPTDNLVVSVAGRRYRARLIGANSRADISALSISGRFLESVPDTRLWMDSLTVDRQIRTEGFSGGNFLVSEGTMNSHHGRVSLLLNTAAIPGMSGGPTYVVGTNPPKFVALTSRSDYSSASVGPYRTFIYDWLPTLSDSKFKIVCSAGGHIQMIPRDVPGSGIIEGPIAVPEEPPEVTKQDVQKALDGLQSTPANKPQGASNQQLRDAIKELLKSPPKQHQIKPTIGIEDDAVANDGEIITINIPVRLRVRSQDRIKIEVIQ